jgi:hypothetical protein
MYGRRLRKFTSCVAGAAGHLAHQQLPTSQDTRPHTVFHLLLHSRRSACCQWGSGCQRAAHAVVRPLAPEQRAMRVLHSCCANCPGTQALQLQPCANT